MTFRELLNIALLVIGSLGGGGIIVAALANWLGKVWADRLIQNERARHERELEDLRSDLQKQVEHNAQTLKEKLTLYKEAIIPIIELVVEAQAPQTVPAGAIKQFEKKRLATTSLLGIFAPRPVFDAYNNLIDFLYDCIEQKRQFTFPEFRKYGFALLFEVRRDIGLQQDELTYSGTR